MAHPTKTPDTKKGKFITFEGGEGAGKSTQSLLLKEALIRAGYNVILTREPGGTEGAEAIRKLLVEGKASRWSPMTELLLHVAARADHVEKVIKPALEAGTWVISDRFADSTIAYQGFGHGLGKTIISHIQYLTLGNFMPDLTFYLDIQSNAGLKRAGERGKHENRYEEMGLDFHGRVREGFLHIAEQQKERFVVIKAHEEIAVIQAKILAAVTKRLGV